ncbi:MAG: CapA family protein [Candidatus Saccharimonadales bacterium]
MKIQEKRRRRMGVWLIVIGSVIILATAAGLIFTRTVKTPDTTQKETVKPVAKPVGVTANDLFFGNMYWGRYMNDWSNASPLKTAYPFSRLNEFQRENYDAWITGLECPTVAGFSQTSAQEDSTLSFNCSPDYLPEAAKWFTAVTLANNHTDNRGPEGFAETKQHLDDNKIQYFGHYDPDQLNDVCEVVTLPVKVQYDDKSVKTQALPFAMCGYHGVFKIPSQESLAVMEQYSKYMPVIAMPHMGVEYKPAPDELKTSTYRSMIDHGADMVIGDHPHWIQNTEAYNGHLIVYSMGNFMFDQQDTAEVVRSAGINVKITLKDADSAMLNKWLALADSCKAFHDTCLEKIKDQDVSKLDFTYQFGVVGTNDSGKITKPATADQQASILQRLDWTKTMSLLQAPYSSL